MKSYGRSQKTATKLIGIGVGTAAAFDPHIGVPIGAVGVAFGLREALGRNALRRKLLKHPKTAALMAQEFMGTEHEAFFRKTAETAKRRTARAKAKKIADKMIGLRTGKKFKRK